MPNRRQILQSISTLGITSSVSRPLHAASVAAPRSGVEMRISRFEVIPTKMPMHERVREAWQRSFALQNRFQTHYDATLVRLYTDAGLVGVCNSRMPAERTRGVLREMIGHSPWEYLLDDRISGILAAVYDLIGQATGLPVSRLFSSSPKKRIVQTWWSQCFPPDLMASEAKLGADLGYRVHKVKARPWEDPIEQAAAICEVIPRDMRVWVDANGWWKSVGRTIFFAERLARFHNYFAIESPITRMSIEGFRQLKGKTSLMITEHMPSDPMPFIREGLLDAFVVARPFGRDLLRQSLMAEVTGVPLWLEHSIVTGVNQVFQAHQAAALPGIEYAISHPHVHEDDLMAEPFEMKDGFYTVPTKPGLGVSLDENAVEKYRQG
ncbi:MAG: mandelate racemase/muconate lactonizing enzyme family protein [Planctomycetota bacterium]|jgi:L-alanine-DL-glutamate epimerase-like enolase superfamily enzyme